MEICILHIQVSLRSSLISLQAGCSEEVVTVVAMLSVQSVWFTGNGIKALDAAKAK